MFLGILQLESGESRKALTSLARAKKLSPQDPAIYRDMAQAYYNLGEARTAVHVWEEVRERGGGGAGRERASERGGERERESIHIYIGRGQHADEQRRLFQPGAPAARAGTHSQQYSA